MNAANLAATIVHFLTFNALPAVDSRGRPLFAYGSLQHNICERRPHFEFGEFVLDWGDEGAQKGWCLYKMGCKGPQAFANCATTRFDEATSWPVQSGHGCIGCTMPGFWDQMGPAYGRLPSWLPFNPDVSVDAAGMALVGGVAAAAVGHGAASIVRFRRRAASERRLAAASASPSASAAPAPDLAVPAAPLTTPAVALPMPPSEHEAGPVPATAPVPEVAPVPEAAPVPEVGPGPEPAIPAVATEEPVADVSTVTPDATPDTSPAIDEPVESPMAPGPRAEGD